jgi:soluble lytic murein transglycosylase
MRRHPTSPLAGWPRAIARGALLVVVCLVTALPATCARASWRARADSLFAEADARFERGDYTEAAEFFARTIDTVEASVGARPASYFVDLAARARFLMAQSHERLEEWEEALSAYSLCLDGLSEVEDLVRFRMAVCHAGADDNDLAMAELRIIIDDGVDTTYDPPAMLELARHYEDADDYDMALQWYRLYLTEAESYNERALAHYRMGRAFERRGDKEAAKRSYATAVNDFPRSRHSHDALKQARKISRSFTDRYHQGLVLYNRNLYGDSAEFFAYYLRHNDDDEFDHEANYFLGRSNQRLGNYRTAARKFEDATEFGPDAEYHDLAWSKLAYCRRASGRLEESLATYERFAAEHPEREAAPELLWEKARLLEEKQRWEEAGAEFRRIVGAYPGSDRAGDALFRAGLCLFKLEDHSGAQAVFEGILAGALGDTSGGTPGGDSGEDAARAHFWKAKCIEELAASSNASPEAVDAYARAVEAARDSYYGARARIRLRELGHAEAAAGGAARRHSGTTSFVRPAMWGGEALEFAAWLAEWYDQVYFQADRVELRQRIYSQPAFRRADVFLTLHLRSTALSELSTLEGSVGRDPRALDILVEYCERVGLHRRAILLAERILAISPAETLSDAPVYLQKRICPIHFSEIVERECAARSIDPNIEYSLIRQESLFEPEAVSWVGARGLSQIMPSTGRWAARRLGHRGFRNTHLFDPATNIRFGTEYLSVQLEEFNGDIVRALAAYNGGPEASERWWGYGGERDSDVFVEDIGYAQTFDYVRRVVRYSETYREIYSRDAG